MGILNVTPDSFSDGGRHFGFDSAVSAGLRMWELGADLIDVGGESTRPGSNPVEVEEELRRTVPVVEALAGKGCHVSIDTMKPQVAAVALDAGAFLVNDVSGLRNPEMLELVQSRQSWVCIMHMKGEPRTMQSRPVYSDVVQEIRDYLIHIAGLLALPHEQIWIDPGIGFGKTLAHNVALLKHLDRFVETGYPVLVGVSRKTFIGRVLNTEAEPLPIEERLEGTLATQAYAQLLGAKVIRAHDVLESRRVIDMLSAIRAAD